MAFAGLKKQINKANQVRYINIFEGLKDNL